jgi:hypothetical protein
MEAEAREPEQQHAKWPGANCTLRANPVLSKFKYDLPEFSGPRRLLSMIFGKRKNPSSQDQAGGAQAAQQQAARQQEPPQQDARQRVFPADLWQGEMGDLLRRVGMNPDDESNFVPTGASIDARIARDRARHEAKLAELNRDVAQRSAGGSVLPFFLIPEPCWNGEMGAFFMARLQFFPFDEWNVLFLPADERTAKFMNAPVCPHGEIPGAVELVQSFVRDAEARLNAAHAEADRTHDFGPLGDTVNQVKGEVWGVAAYIANHIGATWEPPKVWPPR